MIVNKPFQVEQANSGPTPKGMTERDFLRRFAPESATKIPTPNERKPEPPPSPDPAPPAAAPPLDDERDQAILDQVDDLVLRLDDDNGMRWRLPFETARTLKAHFHLLPVALDWLTSHGHEGLVDEVQSVWDLARFPANALQAMAAIARDDFAHPALGFVHGKTGTTRRLAHLTGLLQWRVWGPGEDIPLAIKNIGEALGIHQSGVSHQLGFLCRYGWLRKIGKKPRDLRTFYQCLHTQEGSSTTKPVLNEGWKGSTPHPTHRPAAPSLGGSLSTNPLLKQGY